ncbi:hypothetical protein HDU85_001922 [Gaertneriomyces sp. JEL0708]|nr:hypothetical protein HDU85_001922 [Gaertneriomyces sp. JEL0708]
MLSNFPRATAKTSSSKSTSSSDAKDASNAASHPRYIHGRPLPQTPKSIDVTSGLGIDQLVDRLSSVDMLAQNGYKDKEAIMKDGNKAKPVPPPKPARLHLGEYGTGARAAEVATEVSVTTPGGSQMIPDESPAAEAVYGAADGFALADDVIVGDAEAIEKEKRKFTCSNATKRKSEMMRVYFLDHYFSLLTYLQQRRERTTAFHKDVTSNPAIAAVEKEREWKKYCGKERAHLRKRRAKIGIERFEILKQVGQGGYGQVFLARMKTSTTSHIVTSANGGSNPTYSPPIALKIMSKRLLVRLNETQHILTERDILSRTNSPWLVKLLYSFQDSENVYLGMEFVGGGDMRTLLNTSGCLREDNARFYAAEMAKGVAELHSLGYIHRDLKPENFLVSSTGHLKLTDFGLSRGQLSTEYINELQNKLAHVQNQSTNYTPTQRSINEKRSLHLSSKSVRGNMSQVGVGMRAFSLVGSPDYMAPEILEIAQQRNSTESATGYGHAVDYWSLGAILFELVCGFPPFTGSNTDEVWCNLLNWKTTLERPVYEGRDEEFNLTDDCWDLITKLVCDKEIRLQSIADLEGHPWFKKYNYNFSQLGRPAAECVGADVKYKPPFIPRLASHFDTSYFDDFDNPDDMKMYKEVKERMKEMEKKMNDGGEGGRELERRLRQEFVGFTYRRKDEADALLF